MEKLLLIDGNSIMNRAFYGTQNSFLKNAEGLYTGALFGFLNILFKVLEEEQPDFQAVAFDLRAPTFRHKAYAAYKGTRKGMPEELAMQMPVIKELLDAMRIARFEQEGYEADDILGTLARQGEERGLESVILTGDRDAFQLISSSVTVRLPVSKQGKTLTERYDEAAIQEKYGLDAKQLLDVKALMGDSSDNIPGVPGVGEKTALQLIEEYGSLDHVYEHVAEISKPALRTKLQDHKDLAYLSRDLAQIDRSVPLDASWEVLRKQEYDAKALYDLLVMLEFKSFLKKLFPNQTSIREAPASQQLSLFELAQQAGPDKEPRSPFPLIRMDQEADWSCLPEKVSACGTLYLHCKWEKQELQEVALLLDDGEEGYVFPLADREAAERFLGLCRTALTNPKVKKALYDAKPFALWLLRQGSILEGLWFDPAIASYVADSTRRVESVEEIYRFFTGQEWTEGNESQVYAVRGMMPAALARLQEKEQTMLYQEIEIPLVNVLADFELEGFRVDPAVLKEVGQPLEKRIEELREQIYTLAGRPFNINSPKQLGEILFEELGLAGKKKTKTGYKTSQDVLEELEDQHLIIPLIMEYRQDTKLLSTYIDGLLSVIDPATGRVYSSFNQMVTATGRLSSTEPNLQNIPVRHPLGKQIRRAFVPADADHILIDADYSQIELRILAHISGDQNMIEAFRQEQDIHTITAAEVNHVLLTEVTPEMRSRAKAVNFGLVYGISEFGLARDLGISRYEAKQYITGYFHQYPGVKAYMDDIVAFAKQNGYVSTLLGRRRSLPELSSAKQPVRAFGERIAMNMPIQGTAADIIKLAMIRVWRELRNRGLHSKMILQVHDELLIDACREEEEEVKTVLRSCMEEAYPLCVPLPVTVSSGDSWFCKD